MSNEAGIVSFVYDQRNRLVTNATPAGTLIYAYDANGNQTNILSMTASGVSIGYSYDALNRLTNVVDNRLGLATKNTAYSFDAVGNLRGLKYPNGVTNEWQFDRVNRLTNELWKLSTTTHASFLYTLESAGHRTALSETVNGSSRNYAWSYDALYRLTNETISGAAPTGAIGYRMDIVGNRTNRTSTLSGLTNQVFSYNTNDGLTIDAYDSAGNTRTNAGSAFLYDWANRLTNTTSVTGIGYDANGNRVKKIVGGGTRLYLVSTVNPSGYAQVLEELTVSGGTTNLACAYVYGLDLISQRQPGVTTNFYGTDGLGSTRFLLNLAGGVSDTYVYDAYGTVVTNTGTTTNWYRFAGEQWDVDLGLSYNRARYWSPNVGLFWTLDSYEGNSQDPLSLHKYLYAHADPVNGVDPSGHMTISSVYYSVGAHLFTMGSRLAAFPRALAIVRGTATALTIGSLIVSDQARVTFLATGNPGAAVATLADDVGFMIYRGGTLLQRSASALARSGVMNRLEEPLRAASRRIKDIASDAVVGFRGSVASGVKHSTQGPFDPTDFDLDAFIISDKLANQIPGRFKDGRGVAGVAVEADKIEDLLKQSFSGYRSDPNKPFTFRVWTTEEFEKIVKEGAHVID